MAVTIVSDINMGFRMHIKGYMVISMRHIASNITLWRWPLVEKSNLAMVGVNIEKKPMSKKMKMFLYVLEHLNPDGCDKFPTLCLDHPLII